MPVRGFLEVCRQRGRILSNLSRYAINVGVMMLFALFLMPLFYWGSQYLFSNSSVSLIDRLTPFAGGFVFAVPVVLFQWAVDVYFPLTWSLGGLWNFCFFNKEGIIAYPVLIFLYFYFRKKTLRGTPLRELSAWLCGYYFLFNGLGALVSFSGKTLFGSLYVPFAQLCFLLLASVLLSRVFLTRSRRLEVLYIILYFFLPLFMNIHFVLALLNHKMILAFLSLLTFGGAGFLYYKESRGRLP